MSYDDNYYITDNKDIVNLSFHNLKIFFSGFYVNCYLPITILTYIFGI